MHLPVAPASNSASACTKPNPLAAPLTSTTLLAKLNSGSRLEDEVLSKPIGTFSGFFLLEATASDVSDGEDGFVFKGVLAGELKSRS